MKINVKQNHSNELLKERMCDERTNVEIKTMPIYTYMLWWFESKILSAYKLFKEWIKKKKKLLRAEDFFLIFWNKYDFISLQLFKINHLNDCHHWFWYLIRNQLHIYVLLRCFLKIYPINWQEFSKQKYTILYFFENKIIQFPHNKNY